MFILSPTKAGGTIYIVDAERVPPGIEWLPLLSEPVVRKECHHLSTMHSHHG